MKRDFSQAFENKPGTTYLLIQHVVTKKFLLMQSTDPIEDGWHSLLTLKNDSSQSFGISLAKYLQDNRLILVSYREVASQTDFSYSFVDDTAGTQSTEICFLVRVDTPKDFDLKIGEDRAIFVPLAEVMPRLSEGPFISPTTIASVTRLLEEVRETSAPQMPVENKLNLDEIIEENAGPELEVFKGELKKLTQEELEQLNVEDGMYTPEQAKRSSRGFLEASAAEVTWGEFFAAYRTVMGEPFRLDPTRNRFRIGGSGIFNKKSFSVLIEPFVPGMGPYITPIKYEALTPDLSAFLFTTNGKSGRDHYFVSLVYDFIRDIDKAKEIIQEWHGAIIEFVPPEENELPTKPHLNDISYSYTKIYKGILARVERPSGDGYWANRIIIRPGEDIDAKIAHLSEKQQTAIKNGMKNINVSKPTITIYVKPGDGYEMFYN